MRATRVLSQFAERVGPTSDDHDIVPARPLVPKAGTEFLLIHLSDHLTLRCPGRCWNDARAAANIGTDRDIRRTLAQAVR